MLELVLNLRAHYPRHAGESHRIESHATEAPPDRRGSDAG
jgi:hypothetical protein